MGHAYQIGIALGQIVVIVVSMGLTAHFHYSKLSDCLGSMMSHIEILEHKIEALDQRMKAQDDRIDGLQLAMQIFVGGGSRTSGARSTDHTGEK